MSHQTTVLKKPFSSLPLAFVISALLLCLPHLASSQVIWSDEFDTGTAPDSAVWTPEQGSGGWGNSEIQNYTNDPANLRVENGSLKITAIETILRGNRKSYTSARIKTEDKLTFTYGTIEARIKLPDLSDGLWPAFWTLGNNFSTVGWPDCGELDIMEMGFADAIAAGIVNRRVGSTAHWDYQNSYAGYGLVYDSPSDLAGTGSWHVYRMEWTPTMITTYVDNVQVWAFDISNPAGFSGEEFHQPHFIILNLAVGGSLTGITSASSITAPFPAVMEVDYVRISDNGFTVLGGSSIDPGGPGGGATDAHVASIEPGTQGGGSKKKAQATIVILDDTGAAVSGADVTVTFSGSHNETLTGTTGATGSVTITTSVTNGSPAFTVCVDNVVSSLNYDSAANVETCDVY